MNIKELKERISDLPDNHEVVLSRLFAINTNEEKKDKKPDWYEGILDVPICWKTFEQEKEFWEKRFWEKRFGKMKKFS